MKITNSANERISISSSKNKKTTFKVAASAEFFHILSSNLYKDPKTAVCREIICNAWDSHIANKVNKPIEISFENGSMNIRDFGSGIDPERIEEIYCTYGNSFKTDDPNQTGGFGLGCKSPFAITDSFFVTSFWKGNKYLFNLSRNSVESNGIPTFQLIYKVPTEEPDGLLVSIPTQTDLRRICEKIVMRGGMEAVINGNSYLGYNFKNRVSFVYDSDCLPFWGIRYGNVIYPIDETVVDLPNSYKEFTYISIILKANEGEIDITPSREGLQYSEKTIQFIKKYVNTLPELDIYKDIGIEKPEQLFSPIPLKGILINKVFTNPHIIPYIQYKNSGGDSTTYPFKLYSWQENALSYFKDKDPLARDIYNQFRNKVFVDNILKIKPNGVGIFMRNPSWKEYCCYDSERYTIPFKSLTSQLVYLLAKKIVLLTNIKAAQKGIFKEGTLFITGSKKRAREFAEKLKDSYGFQIIERYDLIPDKKVIEKHFYNWNDCILDISEIKAYVLKNSYTWSTYRTLCRKCQIKDSNIAVISRESDIRILEENGIPEFYDYFLESIKETILLNKSFRNRFKNSFCNISRYVPYSGLQAFQALRDEKIEDLKRIYKYSDLHFNIIPILVDLNKKYESPLIDNFLSIKPDKKIIKLCRRLAYYKKLYKKPSTFPEYLKSYYSYLKVVK